MSHHLSKADPIARVLAALVDLAISFIPAMIPVIGALLSTVYLLVKDAVMYYVTKDSAWRNRSIGKKLFRLEIDTDTGQTVDWVISIRRNIPLCIGSLIAVIPLIGWLLGFLIGGVLFLLEVVLVLSDAQGRRLGDRLGGTTVIPERNTSF